jgi:acetoacetyl-CoA synthase
LNIFKHTQGDIENCSTLLEITSNLPDKEVEFKQVPFDHPLYILYSSGTTGAPKCIVHGHGGTLLQHLKEQQLHADIRKDDRVFYFTTCSWMMWNWLVSALASKATVMLYDGSPFYPGAKALWDFAEAEKFTLFGTSAKYIEALQKVGFSPKSGRNLEALRGMASTGSPLSAEGYDFVYSEIKDDLHLASISGGTDIVSCFVLGRSRRSRSIEVKYKRQGLAWMCKFGMMKANPFVKSVVSSFAHNHFHLVRSFFGEMKEVRSIIQPTMSILKVYGLTEILRKLLSMAAL